VNAPTQDQVEVSVFGPGFGECSLMHIGAGNWIMIDCCIDSATKQPAALAYLNEIGVNLAESVKLVIATHWHDDHIRGMASVLSACSKARFCSSAALSRREFLDAMTAYDQRHGLVAGSGTSEICRVLDVLAQRRGQPAIRAIANRKIFAFGADLTGHKQRCEVHALSPSDAQFELALRDIGNMVPKAYTPKRRAPAQTPNHLSIVSWVSLGPVSFLFGADLEEAGDPQLGWSAILSLAGRPPGKARFFKIPHHGSSNAHVDDVWKDMLVPHPYAVLTPWNRSRGLPTRADVARICQFTRSAFSTSRNQSLPLKRRPPAVEKTIERTAKTLRAVHPRTGHLRMRNGGKDALDEWRIEILNGACPLAEIHAA
jgi:hypothetical protein